MIQTIFFIVFFYGTVSIMGVCAAFLIYHDKQGWGYFVAVALLMVLFTSWSTKPDSAKCPKCQHEFLIKSTAEQKGAE